MVVCSSVLIHINISMHVHVHVFYCCDVCCVTSVLVTCKHAVGMCCCHCIWIHLSCGTSRSKYSRFSAVIQCYLLCPWPAFKNKAPECSMLCIKSRASVKPHNRPTEKFISSESVSLSASELFTHVRHVKSAIFNVVRWYLLIEFRSWVTGQMLFTFQFLSLRELSIYYIILYFSVLYCKYIVYYSFIFIKYFLHKKI